MVEPIQDLIGREEFVGKVCALVDGLAVDQHICIAIDGAWGSGKTFVLQMIEEKLKTHDEYFIIRYDAWANSFYDDPLIAILSCIIDELQKRLPVSERLKSTGKELASSIPNLVPIPAIVPEKYKEELKIFKEIIKTLKKLIRAFKQPFSKDTNQKKVGDFKSYQELLREVKQKLKLIVDIRTKKKEQKKQAKLVFLVDEIDRCLPNEQLIIMERMHHLLDVPNCVVICAVNSQFISKNLKTAYGTDGNEYLEKFFDYKYHLEINADNYLQKLFDSFEEKLKKIQNGIDWAEEPIKQAYQCLLYGSKHVLSEVNNRSVRRYFEDLQSICNEYGWEKLTTYTVFFFTVALFIRKNVSDEFLSQKDILWHPPKEVPDRGFQQLSYHNFLNDYIGLDEEHLPYLPLVHYGRRLDLQSFSYAFNEFVSRSLKKESIKPKNDIDEDYGYRLMSSTPDCVIMRNLIIKYGGETNKTEKQNETKRS